MLALRQHPPKRPPRFALPAVDGIVAEHGVAELVGEAALLVPWVVPPALAARDGEALENEPPAPADAAEPVADPEEITDVGTLNGSKPQLGAPKMKPDPPDVEQNLIPPKLPPDPLDGFALGPEEETGLDAVDGAAVRAAPASASTCAELT
jgi:hypothetical protein